MPKKGTKEKPSKPTPKPPEDLRQVLVNFFGIRPDQEVHMQQDLNAIYARMSQFDRELIVKILKHFISL